MRGYGGYRPRPNYGKLKPTGLINRVGGLMDYELFRQSSLYLI